MNNSWIQRHSFLLFVGWQLTAPMTQVFAQKATELDESSRAYSKGEYELAGNLAHSYLKSHPESPSGRVLLARVFMAQEKYTSAFQELQRALRSDSKHIDALYFFGKVGVILSNLEYQALFKMAPESVRVHQLLAESYRAQEKIPKAEEEYQSVLRIDPRSVEALNALGEINRHQFRFEEAAGYYTRSIAVKPRDYDSSYGLGACFMFLQDPKKAIEYFRRALEVDPNSAAGRLALGDALLRDNQAAAAVTELKAAAGLEPGMRQAYTLLGRSYKRLNHTVKAQEAFRKAQELIQSDVESFQNTITIDNEIPSPSSTPDHNQPQGS